MQVLATDSGTLKDLPAWCNKVGHGFLGYFEEAGYVTLYVRKTR
jgi:TusA-related sulfurtransferase